MADTHPRRVPQPTAALTYKNLKLSWIEGRTPIPEGNYEFWEATQSAATGAVFITIATSPTGSHKTWRDKAYPGQIAIDWKKSNLGISDDITVFGRSTCRVEKDVGRAGVFRFVVVRGDMKKVRGDGVRHRAKDPARAVPHETPDATAPVLNDTSAGPIASGRIDICDLAEDPVYAPAPATPLFKNAHTAAEANQAWDKLLSAYSGVRELMVEISEYEKKNQADGRSPPQPAPAAVPAESKAILTVQLKFCKETRNFYHYVEVDASGNFVRKNEGKLVQDELYIRKAHTRGGARPAAITVLVEPTEG